MARRLFGKKRGGRSRLRRILPPFLALGFMAWLAGFLLFVYGLPEAPPSPVPRAQGIVALTGGPARIDEAMALLSLGKGERLLISGVHPQTTREDVRALVADPAGRFDCCVDLDRAAQNTVGNAIETARWARRHGYRSLIVVTAQYHMPRSLIELARAMPELALTPYPIFPNDRRARDWWREPVTLRLLMGEYTKYLVAQVRIGLADRLA